MAIPTPENPPFLIVITEARVYAADQLFATLDPTLRRIDVADVGENRSGGYGRLYPPFTARSGGCLATLAGDASATLLLHVVDAADVRAAKHRGGKQLP